MDEMERITQLLRRVMQRKAPPKAWKAFVASLPEQDDEAGVLPLQSVTRDVIGAQFFIHYVDAKNESSERRIMVRNLGYFGDELALGAHCFEREAARNFLACRIQKMADLQTGELIDKPFKWLGELSSQNPTAEALERSAPGIQILSCLAWCDGHLNEAEQEVMLRYVDANAASLDLRWDVIGQFVKAMVPSLDAYDRAVARLKFQGSDETRRIISAAKQLVLADGELTLEESELMERLMAYA